LDIFKNHGRELETKKPKIMNLQGEFSIFTFFKTVPVFSNAPDNEFQIPFIAAHKIWDILGR